MRRWTGALQPWAPTRGGYLRLQCPCAGAVSEESGASRTPRLVSRVVRRWERTAENALRLCAVNTVGVS